MQVEQRTILASTEKYVKAFFEKHISNKYAFHNLQHTKNVVNSVREIASIYEDMSEKEIKLLELAAWFHDVGYDEGPKMHEERSVTYATNFLKGENIPVADIETICGCIMATKFPQKPKNYLEEILADADLSHLGKNIYWDRCGKVRQEMALVSELIMNEQEWLDFEIDFMNKHTYHSEAAQQLYQKDKLKHIKQLIKQKARLNPQSLTNEEVDILTKKKEKKKKNKTKIKGTKKLMSKKQQLKQLRLGRGVETMFRTTYRTHVNLSSIADNKANLMLSINAIIISITVSSLVPQFDENPKLILPTIILLLVCLAAIVFATLSTMPKVTEGKFTREDIENKKSNLLFFGNFYNMKMDDFHWGMMEMIKDSDFLYSSMTRDLYFLGIVLAKKYRYLRTCYRIFMFGLIIAVIAFAVSFTVLP